MIDWAKSFVKGQAFFPNIFGAFLNPFFIARKGLASAIAEFSKGLSGRLLDVGCGTKPYRKLFHVDEYIGLEIDGEIARQLSRADFFYDGKFFPFSSGSFNVVLTNQVLEHVFNPSSFLAEIHRVLTPDGVLLLTIPFVWDEHEQPYDYARYTTYGLQYLLENNGFRALRTKKISSGSCVIFQLLNCYIYKSSAHYPKLIRHLLQLFVVSFISLFGYYLARFLPSDRDLFLDQIVLAEKVSCND